MASRLLANFISATTVPYPANKDYWESRLDFAVGTEEVQAC